MKSPAFPGPPLSWGPPETLTPPARAPSARTHPAPLAHPGPWLLPLTLFLFACLFYGGDIGCWFDDYQWAQRDCATDEITGWTTPQGGQFWRPLHFLLTTVLFTALHNHIPIVHLITAAAHAGAALLLHRLLRALGRSPHSAAAGAIVFLTYPAVFQVILWPSALSTGLSSSIVLILFLLALRAGRCSARTFLLTLPLFPLLTFAAACFNEQPVGALVALPLLTLAATPEQTRAARTLLRAALPSALSLPAAAAYIALYISTTHPGFAGTPAALPTRAALLASIPRYAREIRREMRLHEFAPGAFTTGLDTLAAHPALTAAFAAALAVAAVPFLRWWFRTPADGEPGFAPPLVATVRVRLLTAAAGAAAFTGAWLPVIGTGYPVDSRLCYTPAAAALILITLGLDSALSPLARRRPAAPLPRLLTAAALLAAAIPASICLIGVQSALRQRSLLDAQQGHELRTLVPNPPANALFVPVRISHRPLHTGSPAFDDHFGSAWSVPWASRWHIKRIYRRHDVHCNFYYPWDNFPRLFSLYRASPEGLAIHETMGGPFPPNPAPPDGPGGFLAPWPLIIPFEIDARGHIRIITHLTCAQPDAPPLTIEPPAARHLPPRPFHLAHPPAATAVP